MKKALIIGAGGFVGNYLIDYILRNCIWSISATKLAHEAIVNDSVDLYNLNLLNENEIKELLDKVRPDYVFHLAAQSSVALSWENPNLTVDVNIKGTLNILEGIRKLNSRSRVMLIGSGEEYGYIKPEEVPINEDNRLRPGNIYAATKACQNMLGKIYSNAYDLDIISVRAFNHIGPNQASTFVVSDFCKQVAEIEVGIKEPVIKVGNLKAKRDFTDVRDVVGAYVMIMEHGEKGETYNIGSGQAVEIEKILNMIVKLSEKTIKIEVDKNKLRPMDVPIIEADIEKLVKTTGWKKKIDLEQTLKETLEYWREKIKKGNSMHE